MNLHKILNELPELMWHTVSSQEELHEILSYAQRLEGLNLIQCAKLLNSDIESWKYVFEASKKVRKVFFGSRIAIFAPLYVTNICRNDCLYCGFRRSNPALQRKTLCDSEIQDEAKVLIEMGHRRICLVYGDSPKLQINDVARHIRACYETRTDRGRLHEVCVNLEPPTEEEFVRLVHTGLPIYYRVFQETYHLPTYQTVHKTGPKADYVWRTGVFDRAIRAGVTHVGLGILLGLYDYRFEVLSLIAHARYLLSEYGIKIVSVSIPRLRPSLNTPYSNSPPFPVGDDELRRIIALLRLAIPWAEIIITTRERPQFRMDSCGIGVSEMSAGSNTSPGGYLKSKNEKQIRSSEQFELLSHRTVEEVILALCSNGFIPSFWSFCCDDGEKFFHTEDKPEILKETYLSTALSTFREYLSNNDLLLSPTPEVVRTIERVLKELEQLQRKALLPA